jgi:glycosyltransferase involved in cell wall biosynthesis
MHVLLVAFGFPPARASAIATYLRELGHRVSVITADEEYFEIATGTDRELLAALPADLRIVRVPYARLRDSVINRWTRRRAMKPRNWRAGADVEERAIFPETYGAWRDRIVAAAMRLEREDPVDFAIATGNPYVSFVVLAALQANAGVPYLMDDRDSFLYSVYTGERQEDFRRRACWWEPIAERAREAWFVNPPIADLYREDFPHLADRITVVENGWDEQYLEPAKLRPKQGEAPVFGYVGTLNTGFPLAGLIEGWRESRGSVIPADSRLVFVGALGYREQSPAQRELLQDAQGLGIELRGHLPKTRIAEAYEACDALIFAREGGKLVTTGKVYEYVASGLPIAGVVPAEHDSRRILSGYPRAHLGVADDDGAWPAVLAAALADARGTDSQPRQEALAYGQRFRRDLILKDALARVVS